MTTVASTGNKWKKQRLERLLTDEHQGIYAPS